MPEPEEIYMRRAMELAELGRGFVSSNPMVGCLIVKEGIIIGEGWHKKYGEAHAEVNAIASVTNKADLKGAGLYVNLEPCSHQGKTPPCADLIIQYPFKKVIVANTDPNPLVAGKGIQKIRDAGVEVITGVLESEGKELNKRFFTFMQKNRPYIILKWAETADGFIADANSNSKWISNELSRKLVHKWRAEEDAIMVGTNTAQFDNPKLNLRDWEGKDPLRIVIDKYLVLKEDLNLFDGSQSTICYNYKRTYSRQNMELVQVDPLENLIRFILKDLFNRKIQSVIIEGGSQLLNSFIREGIWDEARVFKSKKIMTGGVKAPVFTGIKEASYKLMDDELTVYKNNPAILALSEKLPEKDTTKFQGS